MMINSARATDLKQKLILKTCYYVLSKILEYVSCLKSQVFFPPLINFWQENLFHPDYLKIYLTNYQEEKGLSELY